MRTAVLIATDTYQEFRPLSCALLDARNLAEVLRDRDIGGYQVEELLNAPYDLIRRRLGTVFRKAARDDLILVYFSGHGAKDQSGGLQLVATDTSRDELAETAIATSDLRNCIDHSWARQVVLWLDCCYSGGFPGGQVSAAGEVTDIPGRLPAGRGVSVMTASTNVDFVVPGGEAPLSVFTGAIIEGLRTGNADLNADGAIDATELYAYVYKRVREINPNQTPTRNEEVAGHIYVAFRRHGLQLPPDLPDEVRRNLLSADPIFRLPAVHALGNLVRVGELRLRSIALKTLEQLRAGPDPVLAQEAEYVLTSLHVVQVRPPSDIAPAALPPSMPKLPKPRRMLSPQVVTNFFLWFGLSVAGGAAFVLKLFSEVPAWLPISIFGALATLGIYPLTRLLESLGRQLFSPGRILFKDLPMRTLVFSPDSSKLAAAANGATYVWDTKSWDEIPAARRRLGRSLAFHPRGHVVVGVSDAEIEIVDCAQWRRTNTLAGPGPQIESLCFSPFGTVLASSDANGRILIWNAVDWTLSKKLEGHKGRVGSLAFSLDGTVLASASWDHTIKLWDTVNWQAFETLDGHRSHVRAVAFSPDGRYLASSGADDTIRIWDSTSWRPRRTIEHPVGNGSGAIAFTPDGKVFGYGCRNGRIRLVDTETWETEGALAGHQGEVGSIAFSSWGGLLASAGADRTVRLWRMPAAFRQSGN